MFESVALGKKVFFLYPHPVLTEVAEELARREYEVYLIHDHLKLRRVLSLNGESVLFVNIDKFLDGTNWESYVREILCDSACKDVGVGVMAMNNIEPMIRERYLTKLQVPCGFVILKIGIAKTIEILIETLEANESRGKRKHVRAKCPPGSGICNVDYDGLLIHGDIIDISSVGMAVVFPGGMSFRQGAVLRKMSILVKGIRLIVDAFVAKQRQAEDGSMVTITMFIPNSLDEKRTDKLKFLVYRLNQYTMDQYLKTLN